MNSIVSLDINAWRLCGNSEKGSISYIEKLVLEIFGMNMFSVNRDLNLTATRSQAQQRKM